jgi:hypothetical protein
MKDERLEKIIDNIGEGDCCPICNSDEISQAIKSAGYVHKDEIEVDFSKLLLAISEHNSGNAIEGNKIASSIAKNIKEILK